MIKRAGGFTLIELLITMVIFVFVIAAGSQIFTGLLTQFKQQSKIAETNIEGIVGLEMLRQDIEHSGYGLPWNGLIAYKEASPDPDNLNDSPNPPRAILSVNNATFSSPNDIFDGSDYLVIKAVNIARNAASEKWTVLKALPFTSPYNPRLWTPTLSPPMGEDFEGSDRVIVLSMGATTSTERRLIVDSTPKFYETYNNITPSSPWPPPDITETRIIYGINTSTANTPKRPFNRADYMIRRPTTNMPSRCAQNTGILYKAIMDHVDSGSYDYLPLLDCVADMQVVYGMDTDAAIDGVVNCYTNNLADVLATVDAPNIRDRVREVRVYILAHEGQIDRNFTFNPPIAPSSIRVGQPSAEVPGGSCTGILLGRDFNLSGIPDWQNYRWKVYTMVVKPNNLR